MESFHDGDWVFPKDQNFVLPRPAEKSQRLQKQTNMATYWNDEDLERLLDFDEFDDNLHRREIRPHPYSSPFIDRENKKISPQISLSNLGDILYSSKNPEADSNEETIVEKRSQFAGVNCSNVEEPVYCKQICSRDFPVVGHSEVETGDEEELDVRLLPAVQKNPVIATGGCRKSSWETSGRTSKRIRQDVDTGIVWDDRVDDLARRGMDSNEGGAPGDGRSLPASTLVSSRELPPVQEAAEDRNGCDISGVEVPHSVWDCSLERETSPPITVLGYKIPGPAGAVQNCLPSKGRKTQGVGFLEKYCGSRRSHDSPPAAADSRDFKEGPWLAAMDFLNDGNRSSRSAITSIKATDGRIPQLAAIVDTVKKNVFGDLSLILKVRRLRGQGRTILIFEAAFQDPSGSIRAYIQRKVVAEREDGHLIAPGAVIIFRNVAVFSSFLQHYLNVTVRNVDQIFGKDTIFPRRRGKAVIARNDSGIIGRDHTSSEPLSDGMSQMQTAAKEGYQLETIAPIGSAERQRTPDFTLGDDEDIRADCLRKTSRGSGERTMKNLSLPTILDDSIDSSERAATDDVGDSYSQSIRLSQGTPARLA